MRHVWRRASADLQHSSINADREECSFHSTPDTRRYNTSYMLTLALMSTVVARTMQRCFYVVSEERGRTANFKSGTFRSRFHTDHDRARKSVRTARRQSAICRSKTILATLIGSRVSASVFIAGFIRSALNV